MDANFLQSLRPSQMKRIRRSSLHSIAYLHVEAVAQHKSIRKAATELCVVPSAVSHQITALEEELGLPLFQRLPRGLALTSAGETLLHHVRRAATEIERGRSFVQSLQGQQSGKASLATVEGIGLGPVAGVLSTLWSQWPGIRLNMHISSSVAAFDAVDRGEFDLGLAYATQESPRVKELASADLAIGAIFRSDHPLAKRKSLRLRELADTGLPLLLPGRSIAIRAMLEHALGRDDLRLMPRLETNSVTVISRLAREGLGVAVKTRIGVESEISQGGLVFVPVRELGGTVQRLVLFTRQDSLLPPASLALAGILKTLVEGLAA